MNNFAQLVKLLPDENPGVKILIAQIPPLGVQWADKNYVEQQAAMRSTLKLSTKR